MLASESFHESFLNSHAPYIRDCVNFNKSDIISTDEDSCLRSESFATIKIRGVSTNYKIYQNSNCMRVEILCPPQSINR